MKVMEICGREMGYLLLGESVDLEDEAVELEVVLVLGFGAGGGGAGGGGGHNLLLHKIYKILYSDQTCIFPPHYIDNH